MSVSRKILSFLLFSLAFATHPFPNYFSYYDCDDSCIARNISCLIALHEKTFIRPCTPSAESCAAEATPTLVCLRPNLPSLGGESIWLQYRSQYYSNSTNPESDEIRYKTKLILILSSLAGSMFAAVLALVTTLACILKPCRKNEIPYQRHEAVTPDTPPHPYGQPTTLPIERNGNSSS